MLMLGRKPVSPLCMPYAGIEKATNCILEIPQNLKLELSNNVLTLKAGSVLVKPASVYTTVTVANDVSITISGAAQDGLYVQFAKATSLGALQGIISLNKIFSGTEFPTGNLTDFTIFFNSNEYKFYFYRTNTSSWTEWDLAYPLCLIEIKSGVASFAKDSNGNDMIFNGAGFIGHHAFVYPGVKALIPNGFNSDGSYKNIEITKNSFEIIELVESTNMSLAFRPNGTIQRVNFLNHEKLSELVATSATYQYVSETNSCWLYSNSQFVEELNISARKQYVVYTVNSNNIITNFAIEPPLTKYRWVVKLIP